MGPGSPASDRGNQPHVKQLFGTLKDIISNLKWLDVSVSGWHNETGVYEQYRTPDLRFLLPGESLQSDDAVGEALWTPEAQNFNSSHYLLAFQIPGFVLYANARLVSMPVSQPRETVRYSEVGIKFNKFNSLLILDI